MSLAYQVYMALMERKATQDLQVILEGVEGVGLLDCLGSEARMAMMANLELGDLLEYLVLMVA